MALNLGNFAAALKTVFPYQRIRNMVFTDRPFLAMVPKVDDFYGNDLAVPWRYADPQSRSRTPSVALNARTTAYSKYKKALLTRGHDYASLSIDQETIVASSRDEGAFMNARESEIEGILNVLANSLNRSLFGTGSGIIGQVSSGSNVGTPTITLATIEDISNFEVGMVLQAATNNPADGTAPTLRNSGATATVTGMDEDAGTLTISGNWSGSIAAIAAGDYLLPQGDGVGFSSTSTSSAVAGLSAWLPAVAPSAGENFFGVDRSVSTRLSGIRINGTGMPIEEAILKAAYRLRRSSGAPKVGFLHPTQFGNLVLSLGSKVRYTDTDVATIGFRAVAVAGPYGDIALYADKDCPINTLFLVDLGTFTFHHMLPVPHISVMGNTNGMLQESDAFAMQIRALYWGQLACDAPGLNARVSLDV